MAHKEQETEDHKNNIIIKEWLEKWPQTGMSYLGNYTSENMSGFDINKWSSAAGFTKALQ